MRIGIIMALLLLPMAAAAELTYTMQPFNLTCGPTMEVYEASYNQYGEKPTFKATADNKRIIVWTLNDDASAMSIIVTDPDGTSCVIWSTYCELGECLSPVHIGGGYNE